MNKINTMPEPQYYEVGYEMWNNMRKYMEKFGHENCDFILCSDGKSAYKKLKTNE